MHGAGDGTNAELLLAPLALWSIALALAAACSRRTALALAAGLLGGFALLVKQVALAVRALPPLARRPALGYAAAALVLLDWALRTPTQITAEVLWRRHIDGMQHWGDRTATIATALRPRIMADGDLLVVGRMLGLYHQTGVRPPTRFPFTIHLWSGYAPVDGLAELDRILATRPAFVVVDDLWLPRGPRYTPQQIPVLDRLAEALAAGYVMEGRTGRFQTRLGGFVGGGIGVHVFRRPDVAPFTPIPVAPRNAPSR